MRRGGRIGHLRWHGSGTIGCHSLGETALARTLYDTPRDPDGTVTDGGPVRRRRPARSGGGAGGQFGYQPALDGI
ncbi:MAG: hypothetical protein ACHQDE_06140, partial [Acidimicrobiia bacterium]